MARALVVVPTYNERENVPVIVNRALRATPESVHLLIVDDGSPDGTGASQGHCFQVDLLWRALQAGLSVTEIPITFTSHLLAHLPWARSSRRAGASGAA